MQSCTLFFSPSEGPPTSKLYTPSQKTEFKSNRSATPMNSPTAYIYSLGTQKKKILRNENDAL